MSFALYLLPTPNELEKKMNIGNMIIDNKKKNTF